MIMNKLDEFGASFLVGKTIHYTINPRVHGFLIKEEDNGVVGSGDNEDDIKKVNIDIENINTSDEDKDSTDIDNSDKL